MATVIVTVLIICIILVGSIFFLKTFFPDLLKFNLSPLGRRGPTVNVEFKNQLNKVAEATESESPLQSESITEQPSISQISKDDYIKQLEFKIGTLNKQLLGTATVAVTSSADVLDQDRIEYFKAIADQSYADVKQADPHSDLINLTGPFLKLCMNCKWGTKRSMHDDQIDDEPSYVGLDYVQCEKDQEKHYYSDSCDKWEPRPG